MAEKAMRKENKSKIKMLKAGCGGNVVILTEGVQFDEDVKKMKVDDLKKTLTLHGLATKGLKLELQTRLQNFRDNCKTTTAIFFFFFVLTFSSFTSDLPMHDISLTFYSTSYIYSYLNHNSHIHVYPSLILAVFNWTQM